DGNGAAALAVAPVAVDQQLRVGVGVSGDGHQQGLHGSWCLGGVATKGGGQAAIYRASWCSLAEARQAFRYRIRQAASNLWPATNAPNRACLVDPAAGAVLRSGIGQQELPDGRCDALGRL